MGRVLVTGAAGFAGSHTLDLLIREQADIIAWARPATVVPAHLPRVSWRTVDVTSAEEVERAIEHARPELVFHLAGDAQSNRSAERVGETLSVNVRGTQHLLNAIARHAPAARVIVTSSALVYAPSNEPLVETSPLNPSGAYAVSKLAQETLALRAAEFDSLDVVVARAFNHIGPRQSPSFVAASVARQIALIEAGAADPALRVGNLDPRRDLTDVRDTVRAYRLLAGRGATGAVYNVCRGNALSVRELIDALVARARVRVEIVVDPERLRPVDVPLLVGSHARLTAETGWEPEIPFDMTLDDLLDYWRHHARAA